MEAFLKQIREEGGPAVWSKGVELVRQDAVTGDGEAGGEITFSVRTKVGGVSQTVILSPSEGDWQCSCGGDDDPCAHVAAAAIALKRAKDSGQELPRSASGSGKVIYCFSRSAKGLLFERKIKDGETATLLTVALTALTSGRVSGPAVSATAGDLAVDLALGSDRRGLLPAQVLPPLLKALAAVTPSPELSLDGKELRINPMPIGLAVVVSDEGPGVRLKLQQDERVTELFGNGCALCGDELRPVVVPVLTPTERGLGRDGRFFGRREFAEVVADLLPGLAAKMPVVMHARQLPTAAQHVWPVVQLDLQVSRDGGLEVEGQLHYGEPSIARVKQGQLIALGPRIPQRDPEAESQVKDELRRRLALEVDHKVVLNAAEAVRLVARLAAFPVKTTGGGKDYFTLYGQLQPQLSRSDLNFAVTFAATGPAQGGQERLADPVQVAAAWQRGESLVPLLGGGMAPLPQGWLVAHGEKLLAFLAARGEKPDTAPTLAALPLYAEIAASFGQSLPAGLAKLCQKLQAGPPEAAPSDLAPPQLNGATLRPYQAAGVRWLTTLKELGVGALLADDMGLGKTLQTLAVMDDRVLVVAPTSVLFNWQAELKRFRPDLKTNLYYGPTRALDPSCQVTLTSYALLRLDQDLLAKASWAMLVADEAQNLKNPDSLTTKAMARIEARFRVALSGTPVENHLSDLWSLSQLLNPGLLGDRRFFHEHYAKPMMAGDQERGEALRRRLKPCLLRRLKKDVAVDLPPRTETVLYVELSSGERERYDMILAATRREVLEKLGQGGSVLSVLEALLRLRQAACHPDLLPGVSGEASAKLQLLVETLQASGENGHKTLVFSQWTSFLDLMQEALTTAGLSYLRLDGSTTDRGGVTTAFQQPGGPQVLLMSLKAGGVGLNLTAADHVIIADPWWNPAAEDQAADRAHRIGQERPVLIQRLVALGTVEERILALQEAKRDLAKAATTGSSAGFTALTRDDLVALLS